MALAATSVRSSESSDAEVHCSSRLIILQRILSHGSAQFCVAGGVQ
jgi:hypothetical protein